MPRRPHPRSALSGYADDRLPGWRHAVVERHLLRCTRCALEVEQIRALGEVLRSSPSSEPPDALVDRLLAIGRPAPDPELPVPAGPAAAGPEPRQPRSSVGAAGVLVAAVVMVGTVGAGAVVTGVPVPWPSATTRASVSSVLLPRLWPGGAPLDAPEPGAAVSVQPVDNDARP